jgi:hypothetical protein
MENFTGIKGIKGMLTTESLFPMTTLGLSTGCLIQQARALPRKPVASGIIFASSLARAKQW